MKHKLRKLRIVNDGKGYYFNRRWCMTCGEYSTTCKCLTQYDYDRLRLAQAIEETGG